MTTTQIFTVNDSADMYASFATAFSGAEIVVDQ